ncbi:meiotic recombination protein REC8 homolog [Thalassophryne amazonica]|uniref:meiotic recombination protein REC8 homolog n=1 Tax=Thalassophryne amazonica TaxID=390379 RepID=UPI001471F187|nr:meiotic recombination protein REC8 homolog [Thalassophryne amazonica]
MFYYPTVLKRHSGCFSTIWLVATKGIRVTRRDFLKVNVKNTCDDIMNYVLERVPPPRPDLPRPRFSLYLSSQLQYGVIVVYHRQCAILLEDLQSIVGQLMKQRTLKKIDMDEHVRQPLLFPDHLLLSEETEGAPDPLFGVMRMQEAMPSPTVLIQAYLREESPEQPELISPVATPKSAITASPETITLQDKEPVTIPSAEFEGMELDDQPQDIIDVLLAEPGHFPEEELEIVMAEEQEREIEREEDAEIKTTKELTGSTLEIQPTLSGEEAILLPQEEPGMPSKTAELPADQLTPVSAPVLPSPPSAEEHEAPRRELEVDPSLPEETRRKRKKQLIFFDPETQISEDILQQQISNPLIETRRLLLPSLSHRIVPVSDLLNKPCGSLPQDVLFLWRQAAVITPLSGSDLQVGERGLESTDSEKERELETAPREDERPELSFKEVAREMTEAELFDIPGPEMGSLPLEASDQREVSREISPIRSTPDTERSAVSRSASILKDIPEELEEEPQREAVEFWGMIADLPESEEPPVLFHSLLPPEANRRTVSNIFHRLLALLSAGKLQAEQEEPYGDIMILPGPRIDEIQLTL